eukprot:Nk52_evm20s311 gene=Nk52_evmTU20s311
MDSPGMTTDATSSKANEPEDDSYFDEDNISSSEDSRSESEESESEISASSSEEEEPVEGHDVIVIQPGSLNIRIGLASDPFPKIFPNCIARLVKSEGKANEKENEEEEVEDSSAEAEEEWEKSLEKMDGYIRKLRGGKKPKNFASQCTSYNKNIKPEKILELNDADQIDWTKVDHRPQFLCANEALYVPPDAPYDLHWPIRRGQLNVSDEQPLTSILSDMSTIWEYLIINHLKLPKYKFKNRKVLLIIPDLHDRKHLRELVNMILKDMGFAACMLQHTAVCACVGSGISSACVIDLGDQKTSVCCVEDGVVIPGSRVHLPYGGDDIGRILLWLLDIISLPLAEKFSIDNDIHKAALRQMKEQLCHLLIEEVAIQTYDFYLRDYQSPTLMYSIKMYDEVFRAPLALFFPDVLAIKMVEGYFVPEHDYADPSDVYENVLSSEVDSVSKLTEYLKEKARLVEEERERESAKRRKLDEEERVKAKRQDSTETASKNDKSLKGAGVEKNTMEEKAATSSEEAKETSVENGDTLANTSKKLPCRWEGCSWVTDGEKTLAEHVLKDHIGSGKKDYACKWEGCQRGGRLFGLRSHIVTHMKTHVGEKLSKDRGGIKGGGGPSTPNPGNDINPFEAQGLEHKGNMNKHAEKILCMVLAAQRRNIDIDTKIRAAHPPAPHHRSGKFKKKTNKYQSDDLALNPLPLDEAIKFSISQCENPDTRKRMYASMLVAGGTHLIRGLAPVLEYRVNALLSSEEKKLLEGVEVLANPKGMDPLVLSWKGGSVISRLEVTKEQWIKQGEWLKKGVRNFREKCSFTY